METFEMLINDLQSEILKAKYAAFSRTDVVVNRAVMLDLLSRIIENYPKALQDATETNMRREQILSEAEQHAKYMIDEATTKANTMVAESEVLTRAKAEAQKIDNNARCNTYNMLGDVERSLQDVLAKIHEQLNKLLYE